MINNDKSIILLERIANALDRLAPPEKKIDNLHKSEGFVYDSKTGLIRPIEGINRIPISLLQGIEPQKKLLLDNTLNFSQNLTANNALLWGARGTGKSSLVKAVHAEILLKTKSTHLKLVEIHREDISELPELLYLLSHLYLVATTIFRYLSLIFPTFSVLLSTWFDRDLSLAGRVAIANEGSVLSELVDFERG